MSAKTTGHHANRNETHKIEKSNIFILNDSASVVAFFFFFSFKPIQDFSKDCHFSPVHLVRQYSLYLHYVWRIFGQILNSFSTFFPQVRCNKSIGISCFPWLS